MSKNIADFDKAWISKHQMRRSKTKRTFHLLEGCPYARPDTDTMIEVKPAVETETETYQLADSDLCDFCGNLLERLND